MDNQLEELYFNWLVGIVCNKRRASEYSELFYLLYSTEFVWSIENDMNRAADGIDLRSTFSDELRGWNKPCTVLEMMVGLAKRIENSIMGDGDIDNTPKWFWEMLKSMGIDQENNKDFNDEYVANIVDAMLCRDYDADGMGSLFYVENANEDLRDLEIWSQMCYWLNKNY